MSPWKRCVEPRCTAPAVKGARCDAHRKARANARDKQRPSAVARGYVSVGWRRRREEVLRRDVFCQFGSLAADRIGQWLPCIYAATVAAHIVPREQGGSDELDNLRGLCKRHHDRETAMRDGGFGNAKG